MAATNQVRLRAEARQVRNGRGLFRGDPFSAPEAEAADLVALGFASRVQHPAEELKEEDAPTPPAFKKPRLLSTRSLALDSVEASDASAEAKGRYSRRDLRSSD